MDILWTIIRAVGGLSIGVTFALVFIGVAADMATRNPAHQQSARLMLAATALVPIGALVLNRPAHWAGWIALGFVPGVVLWAVARSATIGQGEQLGLPAPDPADRAEVSDLAVVVIPSLVPDDVWP